jgi:hypothetical protein
VLIGLWLNTIDLLTVTDRLLTFESCCLLVTILKKPLQ